MTASPRSWLRAGLALLSLLQLGTGAWMLFAPRAFYHDVPTVALDPPFNEHLMSDLGALNLSLAVVLAAGAISASRQLSCVALCAYLTYSVPHLIYHATHPHGMPAPAAIALTTSLVFLATAAAVLLTLAARPPA